ncbi:MAG: hypothetical protein ACYTGX_12190 [Planctomycetota bacterium]|jgi:hypothetical protein
MDYSILFNAQLMGDDDDGLGDELVVRYLQVGVVGPHGFTGLVTDYCGGGEWDDLYYFEDSPVEAEALDLDADASEDDLTADDYEAFLNKRCPGLMDAIHDMRDDLIRWEDGASVYPVADGELLELLGDDPDPENVYSNAGGALAPVDGFNTSF